MKKILSVVLAVAAVVAIRTVHAQSAYFHAVTNLDPVLYFPLQETTLPPVGDVETNYGSLGAVADAVYSAATVTKFNPGATGDGNYSAFFTDANGSFLGVPTTDPRTAVTNSAFTLECWVNSAEQGRNYEGIVCKSSGNTSGIKNSSNLAGWCLSQNYIAYLDSANLRGFDFHVFNGIGHEGAEVVVPMYVTNNVWYHLVATFDGTNCNFYVNGQDMVAAGHAYRIPMPAGTSYYPDNFDPIQIGASRNLNGNLYHGAIDEVAIYPGVLSSATIQAHYNTALTTADYGAEILGTAPFPLMYWRMDSPAYAAPDSSTYPVAADHGSFAGTSIQGLYGTAGQPGVAGPQYLGMLDPNNGNSSYGLACNGIGGNNGNTPNVPVGYDTNSAEIYAADAVPFVMQSSLADLQSLIFSPTNKNQLTIAFWFKGNPHNNDRFVSILGEGDSGFRFAMNPSGGVQFCPGPGSDVTSHYSYDDGNWHFAVGTYDVTNRNLYIDGRLDNSSADASTKVPATYFPMFGGAPDYLSGGNNAPLVNGTTLGSYNTRYFSGAVSQFALFTNVLTADEVANLYDTAVSNQPPYIISEPPAFRTSGAGGTNGVGEGSYIYFAAVAGGAQPLSYQWYYSASSNYDVSDPLPSDNVKYFDTTNVQVIVTNLMAGDSGYYFCIITNNYGSITSTLAGASFTLLPTIVSQAPTASFSLYSGQQAEMSVSASGPAPLTYQWYANGQPDTNGTGSSYVSAPQTSSGGSFYCVVSNNYGTVTSATVSVASLLSFPSALTNSLFSSNILASGATAYWPMHETEMPISGPTETNYGTLGAIGDGYDGDWKNALLASLGINVSGGENAAQNIAILHGMPGAIAGDADPSMNFMGLTGASAGFIDVPRGTNGDRMTLRPPFTLEAWVRPMTDSGWGAIIACDGGTADANGNRAGFEWIYSGTADTFSMPMSDGNGGDGSEPKTSANYPPGQWYYLVTTFDGTNIAYYINGVQETSYLNLFSHTNPITGQVYRPDTWDQITIGCARGLGNNVWKGGLDEIAVYTNLLSFQDITNHYYAGTNGLGNYSSTVLAGHPWLYYRMDSPAWTPPALSTWPVLTNFGSIAMNGVYAPNSAPGNGPGPSEAGIPIGGLSANNAMLMDGWNTFADAGNLPQYHPNGKTPFTVAAWVKGNPSDLGRNGWHTMVGEGDGSWRLNMDGGNGRANFNSQNSGDIGNSTSSGVSANINDGNWHYVVGACDGSNTIVYVDGQISATNFNTKLNNNDANVSMLLGGYPANTTTWETNAAAVIANESGRVIAGSVCDAAFWYGKALTPAQITSLYGSLDVAPLIERQPFSASLNQNSVFTNDIVIAGGSGPFAYQWYENGAPRPGQTNSYLNLPNIQPSDASSNWLVVVANNLGSATSAVFTVTVFSAPTLTQDLSDTNFSVYVGAQVPFSVSAVGKVPLFYHWYSNNVAIAGAGASSLLTTAEPANATNTYYCIVSNSVGTVTSLVASVTIMPLPSAPYVSTVIADQPVGFWRLNEPGNSGSVNDGIVANDYIAGNNGVYTNASLQNPPYNVFDTNAASAGFGPLPIGGASFYDSDVMGIPNVDFSDTNGHTSSFTVEAWVKGVSRGQAILTTDAGLVGKGYAGGGEQFFLDCGSDATNAANPYSHSYRFFVRDFATGGSHNVTSTVNPSDASWHHLVGVCDGANGRLFFYIDGLLAGTNSIGTTNGILPSSYPMVIGARAQNATTNNNWQFAGYVEDVAVYNYALSSNQIVSHFNASDYPATIFQNPQDATASAGGSATFSVGAVGSPMPDYATGLAYQWYVNAAPLTGATNSTLVVNNVLAGYDGYSYTVTVTNFFGSATSTPATLHVISGAPQLYADVNTNAPYFVEAGGTISIPVTIFGTEPISYQWKFNGANLSDNDRITGSQSNVLTIAAAQASDAGYYQLFASNGSGATNSSLAQLVVGSLPLGFNTNGIGWTSNSIAGIGTNEIVLTDHDVGRGNGSFWFQYPQYVGAFKASFTYHAYAQSSPPADGIAFCLQNDPRGPTALGGGGGSFGVSGIVPSWELEYNLYPGAGPTGYAININGANSGNSTNGFWGAEPFDYNDPGTGATGPGGDPVDVTIYYANDLMTLTWTDAVAQVSYTTTWSGDIPSIVGGNTAYVGFSGAYGGSWSKQVISNLKFVSIPEATIRFNAPNALITWPTAMPGYVLQESSNLTTPNWVNVPGTVMVTNGMYQVAVPVTSTNEFYRLAVPY